MRITRVESWVENLQLTRPYTIAYATFDHVENVFVRLTTDTGLVALGAGSPAEAITGEAMAESASALGDNLEDLLHGRDPRLLLPLLRRLEDTLGSTPAARAAADIALHDLAAQALGLPLVELLGRAHDGLPTSITLGIQDLESTLTEAKEYLGRGFRHLKLKIGADLQKDLEILEALRRAVGSEIRIRVDANQGYGPVELETFHARSARLDLELLEQPMPAREDDAQAGLPEEIRRLSAADESLHSPEHALRLAAPPQPFGIFNIKLMKCGGVAPALEIAAIARRASIDLMWGCMDESVVSIAAALHAALASQRTRYLDLDGSLDLARDLARGGFELQDGFLRTLDRPGLGIEPLGEGA